MNVETGLKKQDARQSGETQSRETNTKTGRGRAFIVLEQSTCLA